MENLNNYYELVKQNHIHKLGEWCKDEVGGCFCTVIYHNKQIACRVKITDDAIHIRALDDSFYKYINPEIVFFSQK